MNERMLFASSWGSEVEEPEGESQVWKVLSSIIIELGKSTIYKRKSGEKGEGEKGENICSKKENKTL